MPADVEEQLAALGKFWNETIADVEASEIVSDTARRRRSVIGNGLAAGPAPDQSAGIHPFAEQEVIMIELQTASRAAEPPKRPKRVMLAGLLAAAAVLAVVLVAVREDDSESPADRPSPTVTVPPTTPPQALFGAADGQLAPGTYFVDQVEGTATPRILVTLGAGWTNTADWADGWAITKGDGQIMTFSRPDRVFSDACHPNDGDHPGPLTTVDGLVAALSEQRGWIDVTAPADISVDGYAGKAFQRATPHDLSDCTDDNFTGWSGPDNSSIYPPGDSETVWVLDLAGTIVVLETRVNAGQPAEAHAELANMLDSIHIVPV